MERHVYIEAAFTQSEIDALLNVLQLSHVPAIRKFVEDVRAHLLEVDPEVVTAIEFDSDEVLRTRDLCPSCEERPIACFMFCEECEENA